MKYYSTKRIDSTGARYRLIFGERSNGKTYACLQNAIEAWRDNGEQFVYLRRWDEDIKASRMNQLFTGHLQNGCFSKDKKLKKWDRIDYRSGEFIVSGPDPENPDQRIKADKPLGYAMSLTAMEHNKSLSFPATRIIFDEFLTRKMYLPDEFTLLMNTISTIVRQRDDVIIYLLGNTVNKYSPYFDEMGLNKIQKMKPGDLDIYEYGNTGLKLAAEYADSGKTGKASDVYFAFDNPKLQMITSGAWEMAIYPHNTNKYKPKDIIFRYFIVFQNEILQADVVVTEECKFTVIHRKDGEIKSPDEDLVFSLASDARPNWRRNILRPTDRTTKIIASFFQQDLVFYQDNTVGEIVRNYLQACSRSSIIKE